MRIFITLLILVSAVAVESAGNAVMRISIYQKAGVSRFGFMLCAAALLFSYSFTLNSANLEWGRLVGVYVATFFVFGQLVNFLFFKTVPTIPILLGGGLILSGGAVVALWRG